MADVVQVGKPENYYIHDGYTPRLDALAWDDTPCEDQYQKHVYELARQVGDAAGYRSVCDLGCGSGFKLIQFFPDYYTCGIDIDPAYAYCAAKWPEREWILSDLEAVPKQPVELLICSDVIEHFVDPNLLLAYIKKINPKQAVLSTPVLDIYWPGHNGPPGHVYHVREWHMNEFAAYIGSWFPIVRHDNVRITQMVVCKVAA